MTLYFSVILNEFICYVLLLVVVVLVARCIQCSSFSCCCQCHCICASCYIAIVIFISYFYLFSKVLFILFFASLPPTLPSTFHHLSEQIRHHNRQLFLRARASVSSFSLYIAFVRCDNPALDIHTHILIYK